MRFWLHALLLSTLTLAPRLALAQASDEDRAQARQLAIDGAAALERKDYPAAAEKFGRADKLFHAPTLLLGLARAHVGQRLLVPAQEEYQRVVREGVPAGASTQFVEAVEDAKKELAALEPRVPWVTLTVVGPTDPVVTLDGAPVPAAGLGVKRAINPGSHMVKASGAGFLAVERGFSIAEGANEKFALLLERDNAPAATPPPVAPPSDTSSGGGSGATLRTIGVVGLVVGGVALAAGGVTGGLAVREHSILVDDCPRNRCPSSRTSTLSNFHALATLSTIAFVVGGVGVAGGITALVLAPSSKKEDAPRKASVAPYIGLGEVGAVGRF